MTKYSAKFKEEVVRKKLSGRTVLEISRETGVSTIAIYEWLKKYQGGNLNTGYKKYAGNYSTDEKYNLLLESKSIPDENKGEWLRKKGVHSDHLSKWNDEIKTKMAEPNKEKKEIQRLKEELKKAQREIKKKDKALAEAAALLVLKKKYQYLWEEEEK